MFSYTKSGMQAAKAEAKRSGKPMRKSSSKKPTAADRSARMIRDRMGY